MKYVHPDIVISEPIPEIEARVNHDTLAAIQKLTRFGYMFIVVYLTLSIYFVFFKPASVVSIGTVFVGAMVWLVMIFRDRKALGDLKKEEWCVPFADSVKYRLVAAGAGLLWSLPVWADLGLSFILTLGGVWILILGLGLIVVPLRARQPGQISCEGCFYPLVGLSLPCSCPECGVQIVDGQGTTDRPRVQLPGTILVGCVVMVFGGSVTVTSMNRPGMLYGLMPSSAISMMAVTDEEAFEQLTQFPMTVEQEEELTNALLKQSKKGRLGYEQSKWLGESIVAGLLSQEQIDQMMDGTAQIVIDAPDMVRVGDEVEISLASSRLEIPSSGHMVFYFFGGFTIGDDPSLYGKSDHFRSWRYLYKDLFRAESIDEDPTNRPFLLLSPDTPGEVHVRGRVVIVYTDPQNMLTFSWGDEGEGVFENEPLWVQTVDLEHRIMVEE